MLNLSTIASLVTPLAFGFVRGQSEADIVISIDLDLATPGTQSVLTVSPGDSLTAGIVFSLGDNGRSTSLSSYGVSVQFDMGVPGALNEMTL